MRDVYLIFHGRVNKFNQEELVMKKATSILSEVINKSMGGGGAIDAVDKMWLLPGQTPPKQKTAEEIREHRRKVLKYHEQKLAEKRA